MTLHNHYYSANLFYRRLEWFWSRATTSNEQSSLFSFNSRKSLFYKVYSMSKPLPKQKNPNSNPIGSSNLYTNPINLLTSWHLGCLPLGGTKLQPLGIPPIHSIFIELLLLLSVSHGALLSTALARFKSLNQASIIRVELLVF